MRERNDSHTTRPQRPPFVKLTQVLSRLPLANPASTERLPASLSSVFVHKHKHVHDASVRTPVLQLSPKETAQSSRQGSIYAQPGTASLEPRRARSAPELAISRNGLLDADCLTPAGITSDFHRHQGATPSL